MKTNFSATTLACALSGALAFGALALSPATMLAQVAGGSTTVGVSITESTQLAMGWSVKKTLLGRAVYNEAGKVVGKVQDLIVSPDRNVSFKSADAKLSEMKQASAARWKEFEAGVSAATAKLRRSLS